VQRTGESESARVSAARTILEQALKAVDLEDVQATPDNPEQAVKVVGEGAQIMTEKTKRRLNRSKPASYRACEPITIQIVACTPDGTRVDGPRITSPLLTNERRVANAAVAAQSNSEGPSDSTN